MDDDILSTFLLLFPFTVSISPISSPAKTKSPFYLSSSHKLLYITEKDLAADLIISIQESSRKESPSQNTQLSVSRVSSHYFYPFRCYEL